jgi:hypothetical protein
MTVLLQYKDDNTTYSVESIPEADIVRHCTDYLDYVELSTNTKFHYLERDNYLQTFKDSYNKGVCIVVKADDIEQCFAYAHHESRKVLNIKGMHSYYLETIPKSRIILLDCLYGFGLNLRYSPIDKWILPNTSILRTGALKLVRNKQTESIKCKRKLWDSNILPYLKLRTI